MLVFVNNPEKVLATFRSQKVLLRNVLSPDTVCIEASTISPPPAGAPYVPSHFKKFVVPATVLSVTPLTTCPAGSPTVPVNVGEARGALSARSLTRFVTFACGIAVNVPF